MASIKKRGESYQITVSLGRDKQDRKITKTTTFHPTAKTETKIQKEVDEFARDYEKRVLNGGYIDGDEITFEEFANTVWKSNWLDRNTKITARVKEDYIRILNARIIPALGRVKLNKIKASMIDDILHGMTDEGKAPKTVRHTFTVINSVMKYAYKKEYIKENPCTRCDDLPAVKRGNDLHYFTMDQGMAFLASLDKDVIVKAQAHTRMQESGEYYVSGYEYSKSVNVMWKAYFYVAFFGGFRRGEMCALTWGDIDFDENLIRINKAISKTRVGGEIVKDPKTELSVRDIVLPKQCFDILQEWKAEQLRMMLQYGSAWEGCRGNFEKQNVFIQLQNGKPIRVDSVTHKFRQIIERYNASCDDEEEKLPVIRLHDLRHTMITYLFAMGLDPETLSKRAGHSKPSITMDVYGHALKSQDRKASELLESAFFAQK